MNNQVIRAVYNNDTIIVYQAFNDIISQSAIRNQTFIYSLFKKERMTWIKPSFLWMMYRSGWACKKDQENILAISIKREGFEWALKNSCLSRFNNVLYTSHEDWKAQLDNTSVRIQWDPERDIFFNALSYRSIQIGLSGVAAEKYLSEWIVHIENITGECKNIHQLIINNKIDQAKDLLPIESPYPLPDSIALKINAY